MENNFTLSKNRIQFNYRRILDKKSFPDAIALQTKNIIWQSKKDADQRDEEEMDGIQNTYTLGRNNQIVF